MPRAYEAPKGQEISDNSNKFNRLAVSHAAPAGSREVEVAW
jgi:hypothetical protein